MNSILSVCFKGKGVLENSLLSSNPRTVLIRFGSLIIKVLIYIDEGLSEYLVHSYSLKQKSLSVYYFHLKSPLVVRVEQF